MLSYLKLDFELSRFELFLDLYMRWISTAGVNFVKHHICITRNTFQFILSIQAEPLKIFSI